ncbi:MAG: LysM peptidoglycan-binding domain-containing protein, partial [Oscillospiraceae bacterium]|nr:LysM peptidoglycan-binding domain-containing protein [Oscillospiraceae bacterium]
IDPGQEEEGGAEQPSLVLRMLEGGERLWDVAKAYKTTIADIIKANELESGADGAGKLLLIPRRR